jgi:MFS family permease
MTEGMVIAIADLAMSFPLKKLSDVLTNTRLSREKSAGGGFVLGLPDDSGLAQKSNSLGLPAVAGLPIRIWSARGSLTLRILATSVLIFACYFTIGLQLAVVPGFVHLQLGYSAIIAGLAISFQYVATLTSRPFAGRMADSMGAKRTTLIGLLVGATSGIILWLSSLLVGDHLAGLSSLLLARLVLGFGESWIATGATLWAIGRVGASQTAKVISWSGIASYGAIALGAPVGLGLEHILGFDSIGAVSIVVMLAALLWASRTGAISVVHGEVLALGKLFQRVFPYGLSLALGGIGFGTIASFITLYYASRHWQNPGISLSLFGLAFVSARLLFENTITKFGGYRVAIISLACESFGLVLLWLAGNPMTAEFGAVLTGFGFSLVFPALGVEAVRDVPTSNRGSALGLYTAFIDLSLGISGPIAGVIVSVLGYPQIFFFAAAMAGGGMALPIMLYRNRVQLAKGSRVSFWESKAEHA